MSSGQNTIHLIDEIFDYGTNYIMHNELILIRG